VKYSAEITQFLINNYSVYADALLCYQQGRIGYATFCWYFQVLSS